MIPHNQKGIALVVGHSARAQGATVNGLSEWALNSTIAHAVKRMLREDDLIKSTIYYRTALADRLNQDEPRLIVSMHANSSEDTRANGSEVLYWHSSQHGSIAAARMQQTICTMLRMENRGTKAVRSGQRGAMLLGETKAVAILVEPFFLSNLDDRLRVLRDLDGLVWVYATGIRDARRAL
jgi:N-acetylmuramoyl-L-alanine amidase